MYSDIGQKEKTTKQEIIMKTDIILSGVGGQGILSIAAIIGEAAREKRTLYETSRGTWDEPARR